MKNFKTISLVFLGLFVAAMPVLAAYKDTDNAKIHLISAWSDNGNILVQTNPKHDISGLSCTNDYWLALDKDSEGYQAILSMLLSAQASKINVKVRAQDNGTNQFCRLSRIINKAS